MPSCIWILGWPVFHPLIMLNIKSESIMVCLYCEFDHEISKLKILWLFFIWKTLTLKEWFQYKKNYDCIVIMWDFLTKHMYFNACIYNINVTWTVIKYHFFKKMFIVILLLCKVEKRLCFILLYARVYVCKGYTRKQQINKIETIFIEIISHYVYIEITFSI